MLLTQPYHLIFDFDLPPILVLHVAYGFLPLRFKGRELKQEII